jgi:hypothetical protein
MDGGASRPSVGEVKGMTCGKENLRSQAEESGRSSAPPLHSGSGNSLPNATKPKNEASVIIELIGGPDRDRTDDLFSPSQ